MYEAGRLGGALMYMKYLKPGMPFRPADYYPFPWDPQPELMQLTPELIAAAKAFDEANPL